MHYSTLHYTTLNSITLHYTTLYCITLHYITLHYIALHCSTVRYTTLNYIPLHYITLHSKCIDIVLHNCWLASPSFQPPSWKSFYPLPQPTKFKPGLLPPQIPSWTIMDHPPIKDLFPSKITVMHWWHRAAPRARLLIPKVAPTEDGQHASVAKKNIKAQHGSSLPGNKHRQNWFTH